MHWIWSLVIISILLALNMFMMDTVTRMRADIQIIRKAVAKE